jgi:hypothetical protein
MLLSRYQHAGQNQDIKIGNRSFENVAQFRYLGTTITNRNLIQEETKRRLSSGNACYHSVQSLLSSGLLSKSIKFGMCKAVILPVVLYGCETWSLELREEHGLRVFESGVLSRVFGPRRDEVTGDWRELHNEALHGSRSSPYVIGTVKSRRIRWAEHVARMREEEECIWDVGGRAKR